MFGDEGAVADAARLLRMASFRNDCGGNPPKSGRESIVLAVLKVALCRAPGGEGRRREVCVEIESKGGKTFVEKTRSVREDS